MANNNYRGQQRPPFKKRTEHNINDDVRHASVRLVGDNVTVGVYTLQEAKTIAKEQGLDLVEIPTKSSEVPICRVVEYTKFLYDQKKKEKEQKKKQTGGEVKELRMGQNIDDHDFAFKKRYAEKFLEDGCKVRVYVQFRGRAIVFKEQGELVLLRLADELKELGKPETLPQLDGKKMMMTIAPKKKI